MEDLGRRVPVGKLIVRLLGIVTRQPLLEHLVEARERHARIIFDRELCLGHKHLGSRPKEPLLFPLRLGVAWPRVNGSHVQRVQELLELAPVAPVDIPKLRPVVREHLVGPAMFDERLPGNFKHVGSVRVGKTLSRGDELVVVVQEGVQVEHAEVPKALRASDVDLPEVVRVLACEPLVPLSRVLPLAREAVGREGFPDAPLARDSSREFLLEEAVDASRGPPGELF